MSQSKTGKWSGNRTVAARLPDDVREKFDTKCQKLGLSSAEGIRLAVQEFIEKEINSNQ